MPIGKVSASLGFLKSAHWADKEFNSLLGRFFPRIYHILDTFVLPSPVSNHVRSTGHCYLTIYHTWLWLGVCVIRST